MKIKIKNGTIVKKGPPSKLKKSQGIHAFIIFIKLCSPPPENKNYPQLTFTDYKLIRFDNIV
jgi:hypothetical protein